MTRFVSLAILAAAAALSACSTVGNAADAVWPFNDGGGERRDPRLVPEEGRISILTFEQQLSPDPALASKPITPPAASPLVSWTQPGGVADNAPSNISGSANLDVAWRQSIGAGSNENVRLAAPPVIGEGKIFFLDADHHLVAADAASGSRLWSVRMRPRETEDRNALGGGVAFDAGRVYVTSGYGFVACLDGATGQEVWRTSGDAPFHAAPTVSGGRVFAVSNDSELVALDANDGRIVWNYQAIAEPARILAASSPAVDGDTVIAPFASGEVVALLGANGRRLWVDSLSRSGRLTSLSAINDIAGRPVVDNGVVFAASHSGVLAAIDLRTGQRMWSRAFASTQTPWIAGDVLYAVSSDSELAAFDRTTGTVYWVRQLRRFEDEEDRKGRVAWAGPIMVGGKLVLASSLGEAVAVAPENGEVSARRDIDAPVFIPPIAANGLIYLTTDQARLVVLR
jgi:outer membrane protein assembly factor BamB